jgi:hypothetical protein
MGALRRVNGYLYPADQAELILLVGALVERIQKHEMKCPDPKCPPCSERRSLIRRANKALSNR